MPLVASVLLAWVAGLLSGLRDVDPVPLAGGAAVVWFAARRARERIALAALLAASVAVGSIAAGDATRCSRRALAGGPIEVDLDDDASPGAFVPGRTSCGALLRLSVRSGNAPAGARVLAQGRASGSRAGVVIEHAALTLVSSPGPLRRLRSAVGRGIDSTFGGDAPLVRALLIADMSDVPASVRARFAAAGLSHMLSVSGLHVGLIAAAVLLIAQVGRASRRTADVLVVVLTAFYVAMIGAPLPAVRSAVMLAAASASLAAQRPTSPWAVLAVGASAPVFDPAALLDVGYQLSVAGMVALVAAGGLAKRWSLLAAGGWRGTVIRGLSTSVIATLITAPLVASTFGRLSLVAPLTNLVAAPAIAVLQPMLFLAAVLLPVPAAAHFVADACHPLLAFLDGVAARGAALPGASIPVTVDAAGVAVAIAGTSAVAIACVSRHWGRPLVVAALCAAALVWRPMLAGADAATEIHIIDVGQGDAIAVRSRRGHWVLFDAGREWEGGDAGARDVVPYISRRGGSLDGFVLSHPHADHVGGAASVVRALRPVWYVDPAYVTATGAYSASLVAAREAGTRWRRAIPGDSIVVDEMVLTVLAPEPRWADTLRDPNEASVVVRLRVGDVSMLFTGDAESGEERWLEAHSAAALRADVLKVAHHGSRTSSTDAFLDAVRPALAVISVGQGNMYRHPSPEIVRALAAHGAVTLRTDRLGSIVIRTDGKHIDVDAGGDSWRVK